MTFSRRSFLGSSAAAVAIPSLASAGGADTQVARTSNSGVANGRTDGVKTSGARMVDIPGGHQVWIKQVGDGPIPVLLLHGGPGMSHFYFECFEEFLPVDEFRFFYYDQLGCGFSDRPEDLSLWTVDRYREEVEAVRVALGLDRFVLFGHSWGGMLGMEYALRYQQHLSALVVSNMTAGVAAYVKYANELRAQLPAEVRQALKSYEDKGQTKSDGYQKLIMDHLYTRHLCRSVPWPEPVSRTMRNMNSTVYETMQGPDEFNIVGNFKDWDRWNDLHLIKTTTLLMVGRHDTMSPQDILRMSRLMPRARAVVCENGSHMALYDDQAFYFASLLKFLREPRHV